MTTEEQAGPAAAPRMAGPRGIGTAVAFDWGLVAQMLFVASAYLFGFGPGGMMAGGSVAGGMRAVVAVGALIAAVPCFLLGEGIRRGFRPARPLQVVLNALLTIAGIVTLPSTIADVRGGHYSGIVRSAILLIASPAIVWLLTRPQTRDWFAQATSAQARARHSGWWLVFIALWAIGGGAAVAFGASY